MGQWLQRFASNIHGEVSDATIQGYLRSASQLEEIWQQIDDGVDALLAQGLAPWDAYARMGYALAFVRACRTNVVFVQELLRAATAASPSNPGYLPKMTFEQALALCEHIEPYLEEAIKASTNTRYVPAAYTFPLKLGPYIGHANQRIPLPHLQGIIAAAQQMRDWAAGLLAKYELALGAAKTPVPQHVTTHLEQMKSELSLGDFHLRTGVDMVGQVSKEQTTNDLSEKAEGFLWEAMEGFFKVSQLVAMPGAGPRMPQQAPHAAPGAVRREQAQPTYIPARQQQQPAYVPPRQQPQQPQPQVHAQPLPPQPPPPPDASVLMNQVIAGSAPGAVRPASTPATPQEPDMLKQVIAGPGSGPARKVHEQPVPEEPDSLSQVIAGPGSEAVRERRPQPAPQAPDLLDQMLSDPGPGAAQEIAAPSLLKDAGTANSGAKADRTGTREESSSLLGDLLETAGDHKGTQPTHTPPTRRDDPISHKVPTGQDDVMDLFSQVCGEQKDNN